MTHRADTVALLLFINIAVGIPAVVVVQHFLGMDLLSVLRLGTGRTYIGAVFAVLATAVAALNGYLNFVSPWLHKRQHGDMKSYSHVSGLPGVGGFLVLFAALLIPASPAVGSYLFLVYFADSGGLPWFLLTMLIGRNSV
jgi:hypothetical protein